MTWIILDHALDGAEGAEHIELIQQTCIKAMYFYAYRTSGNVEYKQLIQKYGLPPQKRYHMHSF